MASHYSIWTATLSGGLIAGTIDIGAAALINWKDPVFILHAIAGGAFGIKESFAGGWPTAAAGLLLQWGMSIIIAAIYVLAATIIPVLRQQWLLCGLFYGVPVFFVMNYVVVPLSAIGHAPHFTPAGFIENLIAMLLFGAIVAYFARTE